MAIYKPSNFYPNLNELDWSNIDGQTFECQINTDGATAKAYKVQIFSSNGILLYENLNNFSEPIENKEFAQIPIALMDITSFNESDTGDKTSVLLSDSSVKFIALEKNTNYDTRQTFCPFCLYNIKKENANQFCVYHMKSDASMTELKIKNINDNVLETDSYTFETGDSLFIGLRNSFDYKWTVRIYENVLGSTDESSKERNTFVSSGYITGTNQGVILYKDISFDNLLEDEKTLSSTSLRDNYVKMNNYIELRANKDNSYIFKNQQDYSMTIILNSDIDKLCFSSTNVVDFGEYKDNIFAKIELIQISQLSHFQEYSSLFFDNAINKTVLFDKVVLVKTDDDNIQEIIFNNKQLQEDLLAYKKNVPTTFENDVSITLYFSRREKIYDISNNLGTNSDINQILLDDDFEEYLKNGNDYYLYTCDNKHTNRSAYVSPNGEIQVGRYIRFPMIDEKRYNQKNFPSSNVSGQSTTSKQGMYVKTQYFNVNDIYTGSGYYLGQGSAKGLTQNSVVFIDCLFDDSGYRVASWFLDTGYIMPILEEEWALTNSDRAIKTGTYFLKISISDVSTANDPAKQYGYAYGTATNNYYNIIVPSFYTGAFCIDTSKKVYCIHVYIPANSVSSTTNSYPVRYDYNSQSLYFKITNTDYFGYDTTNKRILVPRGIKFANEIDGNYYLDMSPKLIISEEDYNAHSTETNYFKVGTTTDGDTYYYIPILLNGSPDTIGSIIRDSGSASKDFSILVPPDLTGASRRDDDVNIKGYITAKGQVSEEDLPLTNGENSEKFKENKNSILYKIIGYDEDSGEIRLENNVYRTLTDTDVYEIWERYEESGETSTEYYTRRLPQASAIDDFLKVGGEIKANIKCCNSYLPSAENGKIYIQPNINMKTDENFNPRLIFENGDIVDVLYDYDLNENRDYSKRDKSINKLDNSQWIISTQNTPYPIECGSVYSIYECFADSVPENYFYARSLSNISVKYCDSSAYNNDNVDSYKTLGDDVIGKKIVMRCMNGTFKGIYTGITPIRKYRYKLFDENDDIVVDTEDIYANNLLFSYNGFANDLLYTLQLEVEDQLGYIYHYSQSFYTQYTVFNNIIQNNIQIKPSDEGNGLTIFLPYEDFLNLEIYDTINVYKKQKGHSLEYITQLSLIETNLVEISQDEKVLGFIDYNVLNDTWYDYIFVLDVENLDTQYSRMKYTILTKSIKTCFQQWCLSELEKIDNDSFTVKDIWELKCNLEGEEITTNTSVTKWDVIGKYAQVSMGERQYDSGSISCLLGDVSEYQVWNTDKLVKKNGYNEYDSTNIYSNNSQKLKDWKEFCKNSNLKLLQDFKGNKWIVQIIENPSYNINLQTQEQMSTISCMWTEVLDSDNKSIIKNLIPYKNTISKEEEQFKILRSNWTDVSVNGNIITLSDYKSTGDKDVYLDNIEGYNYEIITYNNSVKKYGPFENVKTTIESFRTNSNTQVTIVCDTDEGKKKNNLDYLFAGCVALTTIESDLFASTEIYSYQHTFDDCEKLNTEIIFNQPFGMNINLTDIFANIELSSHKIVAYITTENDLFNFDIWGYLDENYGNNSAIQIKYNEKYKFNINNYTKSISGDTLTLSNYTGNQNIILIPRYIKYGTSTYTTVNLQDATFANDTLRKISLSSSITSEQTNDHSVNPFKTCTSLNYVYTKYNKYYYYEHQENGGFLYGQDFTSTEKNRKNLIKCLNQNSIIQLSSGITRICTYAFYGLQNLSTLFYYMPIDDNGLFTYDKSWTSISNQENFGNSGIQEIEDYVFVGCLNLLKISLPTSISTVASNAFKNSSILQIAVNKTGNSSDRSTYAGGSAADVQFDCVDFEYCEQDTTLERTATIQKIQSSVNSVLQTDYKNLGIDKRCFTIGFYHNSFQTDYISSYSVKEIENKYIQKLKPKYIYIDKIYTSFQELSDISRQEIIGIGLNNNSSTQYDFIFNENCFKNCINLKQVNCKDSRKISCKTNSFSNCTKLQNFLFTNMYAIEENAFSNTIISSFAFNNMIPILDYNCFNGMSQLTQINFNCSIVNFYEAQNNVMPDIGIEPLNTFVYFRIADNLYPTFTKMQGIDVIKLQISVSTSTTLYDSIDEISPFYYNLTYLRQVVFTHISTVSQNIECKIPDCFLCNGNRSLYVYFSLSYPSNSNGYRVDINEIGNYAFKNTTLQNPYFPKLKKIGDYAFYNTVFLSDFSFGTEYDTIWSINDVIDNTATIGNYAFANCYKSLHIPSFISNISETAFYNCSGSIEINQYKDTSPFKDNYPFGHQDGENYIYWREKVTQWQAMKKSGVSGRPDTTHQIVTLNENQDVYVLYNKMFCRLEQIDNLFPEAGGYSTTYGYFINNTSRYNCTVLTISQNLPTNNPYRWSGSASPFSKFLYTSFTLNNLDNNTVTKYSFDDFIINKFYSNNEEDILQCQGNYDKIECEELIMMDSSSIVLQDLGSYFHCDTLKIKSSNITLAGYIAANSNIIINNLIFDLTGSLPIKCDVASANNVTIEKNISGLNSVFNNSSGVSINTLNYFAQSAKGNLGYINTISKLIIGSDVSSIPIASSTYNRPFSPYLSQITEVEIQQADTEANREKFASIINNSYVTVGTVIFTG